MSSDASPLSTLDCSPEDIVRRLREMPLRSFLQPIVDLFNGEIFGYEMLARGQAPLEAPDLMFALAAENNVAADLELACRKAAFEKIATCPSEYQKRHFFVNLSPETVSDPGVRESLRPAEVAKYGINQSRLVLEITETASVKDYDRFEDAIRHFTTEGFRIALDDFGSGHSGLITLIAVGPHFMKVDKEIIRDINGSAYKQKLLRAVVSFAQSVGSEVIAEGIETWDELRTVFRLGARYGQGYVLGRPNKDPMELAPHVAAELRSMVMQYHHQHFSIDLSINPLMTMPITRSPKSMISRELDQLFRRDRSATHLVVTDEGKPVSLITREHFYDVMSGQYGYAVYSRKFIDELAKTDMMIVDEKTDLRAIGRIALSRDDEDLYDPIIATDSSGRITGTITMRDLLFRAFDAEVKLATSANPLTGLPGNTIIGEWLDVILKQSNYSVLYFDLDRFKEYNDSYGFAAGDEMIKFLASLIQAHVENSCPGGRVGHIGGDDFILLCEHVIDEADVAAMCRDFDERKLQFFSAEHVECGCYESVNRRGETEEIALVTLSVAVVTSSNFTGTPHPGKLSETVSKLKSRIKRMNMESRGSGYLFERRRG